MYNFNYDHENKKCDILMGDSLLGSVWIDETGAWNVDYEDGVKYLPINDALKYLEPIFTFWEYKRGQVFEFYSELNVYYKKDSIISVWCKRENNSLINKIVYGKARVIEVPHKPTGLYKAMMVG